MARVNTIQINKPLNTQSQTNKIKFMNKAILTISKLTDKINGWGMPIIEVNSSIDIEVINRGWNDFEPLQEIDESDLLRLREYFSSFSNETIMLEIICPNKKTNCWYKLTDVYIGGRGSNIIW